MTATPFVLIPIIMAVIAIMGMAVIAFAMLRLLFSRGRGSRAQAPRRAEDEPFAGSGDHPGALFPGLHAGHASMMTGPAGDAFHSQLQPPADSGSACSEPGASAQAFDSGSSSGCDSSSAGGNCGASPGGGGDGN